MNHQDLVLKNASYTTTEILILEQNAMYKSFESNMPSVSS
jgi:hypothetical protein